MNWRGTQADSRLRYLAKFDAAEAERYDAMLGNPVPVEQDAYLADLATVVNLRAGQRVLDAGAGTGALSLILSRVPGLAITALEPAPEMLALLRSKPALREIATAAGFCDAPADRQLFEAGAFDVIASRQLVNGLYDPLTAFANWHHWLAPDGKLVVVEGLYDRSSWTGAWQSEIDTLPASTPATTALVPYLLETAGFQIAAVRMMAAVNALPSTRTPRYVVVAVKAA
jgi:ubiquinone/menaquinone biosynthesis C-methylase UbiE